MNDPVLEIAHALERAAAVETNDATAASLATVDTAGKPSVRMVLIKGCDARGVTFYTNLNSRKARELGSHPYAALCLYWPVLGEQVRIEGAVQRVDAAEADAYFSTRGRESQIGAWASDQSAELVNRSALLARVAEFTAKFESGPVPRPDFWSGFLLIPDRIEFWRAGEARLHHRTLYERQGSGWRTMLLNP